MKFFTTILLFITLFLSLGKAAVVRTLSNSAGAKIEAEITGIWQGKVTFLRVSDRKSFTLPINSLSPEDQDFLNQRLHVLALPPTDSGFAEGAVIIAGVKGSVKVVPDASDGSVSRPAKVGENLAPDARITTGEKSSAILLFTNGTIATVIQNTSVLIKVFLQSKFEPNSGLVNEMKTEPSSSNLRLDLEAGNLIVDVKKLNKGSSFAIHSPVGVVGIRGTQFHLYYRGDASYLEVVEGTVDYAGGALPLRPVASGKRQEALKVAGRNDPALNPIKDIPAAQSTMLKNYLKAARENDFVAKARLEDLRKAAFKNPGELIWKFETAEEENPVLSSVEHFAIGPTGTVYLTTMERMFALDGKTGEKEWGIEGGQSFVVVGIDSTVYRTTIKKIEALDGQTGKQKWEFEGERFSRPAIGAEGTVFVSSEKNLYALDEKTGKEKWNFAASGSDPIIDSDGTIYITTSPKGRLTLLAISGKSGRKRWSRDLPQEFYGSPEAIGSDDVLFFSSRGPPPNSRLSIAYSLRTKTKKWESPNLGFADTPPVIGLGGTVFLGQYGSQINKGMLYAVDERTGRKKWELPLPGRPSVPVIGDDGTVYFGTNGRRRENELNRFLGDNKIYAVDGQTGKQKWEFETDFDVTTPPALGPDGTLYFGTSVPYPEQDDTQHFYAIATESNGPAKSPWPMFGQNAQRTSRTPKK